MVDGAAMARLICLVVCWMRALYIAVEKASVMAFDICSL